MKVMVIFLNSPSLSFITIHDDIDIADPSSMQDACHRRTQLVAWIEHPPGVREVIGSTQSCRGLRSFSLLHARVIVDHFIFHNTATLLNLSFRTEIKLIRRIIKGYKL